LKVLNLYAGIGGNRKLWEDVEVTAVERDEKIASIYQDFFPKDKIVVGDAHQYLLEHFGEFDFIWSSPPCPTHSRVRKANHLQNKPIYPCMKLYEEILLLKHYFKGKYCVENVISFYEPLIRPSEMASHYFWHNFHISKYKGVGRGMGKNENFNDLCKLKGFDISKYSGIDKMKTIRNCVEPEVALHILNEAKRDAHSYLF
jgi:DNA (cytosine-5)-methyltransferase 1